MRNSSVQDNTINLEFEDEPLFKITKIRDLRQLKLEIGIPELFESYNEFRICKRY